MKYLSLIAASAVLFGIAQAASVTVANSDFEADYTLSHADTTYGDWEFGAVGWQTVDGAPAGTFEPLASVYASTPAEIGARVGFVNSGQTMWQDLGVTIDANTDYSLSALFGHRFAHSFAGEFGFYAGTLNNVIGSAFVVDPGEGGWGAQSFLLDAAVLAAYAGQQLGIFVRSNGVQLNFDRVYVEAISDEDVLVNPVPAAVWLFGSALFAGAGFSRRKKAA